jgi:hypothetical protein
LKAGGSRGKFFGFALFDLYPVAIGIFYKKHEMITPFDANYLHAFPL